MPEGNQFSIFNGNKLKKKKDTTKRRIATAPKQEIFFE